MSILKMFSKSETFVVTDGKSVKIEYVYLNPRVDAEPNQKPYEFCLIFLHGRNESSESFYSLFKKMQRKGITNCRLIMLRAPNDSTYHPSGAVQWFDIFGVANYKYSDLDEICKNYNQEDLHASSDLLVQLVLKEIGKFPDQDPRRVFLGGFSQGAIVTLAAFLKLPRNITSLGGVFGLSGLQAMRAGPRLTEQRLRTLRNTPCFLYHGEDDGVCPLANTMMTYNYFKRNIYGKEF